jgi:FRG domain
MEELAISGWDEFEDRLRELERLRNEGLKGKGFSSSEYLFRGHGDGAWLLETTLDRFFSKRLSLSRYYRFALLARSRIESFTGAHWNIPTLDEYENWVRNHDQLTFHDFIAYEYLAYLRHHGFPSPLLDWTESPYIAAFFAFRHIAIGATNVAVYAYQECPGVGKISSSEEPVIHRLGPYVSAHKRHFLQQSQYTFCTEIDGGTVYYTKHQNVVARNDQQQDLLWKFNIPVSERRSFLAQLNKMNINAFSLFGSEDSLVETIAVSEIYVRGRDLG